jgi:hypothetical protein
VFYAGRNWVIIFLSIYLQRGKYGSVQDATFFTETPFGAGIKEFWPGRGYTVVLKDDGKLYSIGKNQIWDPFSGQEFVRFSTIKTLRNILHLELKYLTKQMNSYQGKHLKISKMLHFQWTLQYILMETIVFILLDLIIVVMVF